MMLPLVQLLLCLLFCGRTWGFPQAIRHETLSIRGLPRSSPLSYRSNAKTSMTKTTATTSLVDSLTLHQQIEKLRETNRISSSAATPTSTKKTRSITTKFPMIKKTFSPIMRTRISTENKLGLTSFVDSTRMFLAEWWWKSPMLLAVIPAYRWIVHQAVTMTPSWWKMQCMEYIRNSPDATMVVSCFLMSNLSFFLAGGFLLQKAKQSAQENEFGSSDNRPEYLSMGLWVFASGLVSTIFHSLQALGTTPVAEAACYVDHGVAGTAFLYFLRTCGLPRQKRVWAIGGAGILALSLPLRPGYSWLHSSWHGLAALSACLWGMEKETQFATS